MTGAIRPTVLATPVTENAMVTVAVIRATVTVSGSEIATTAGRILVTLATAAAMATAASSFIVTPPAETVEIMGMDSSGQGTRVVAAMGMEDASGNGPPSAVVTAAGAVGATVIATTAAVAGTGATDLLF